MSESTLPDFPVFPRSMVAEVERPSFARADWTHEAHIAFATWVILDGRPDDALPRIRQAIRQLNESFGNQNTADDGYHETITAFYVRTISAFVESRRGSPKSAVVADSVALFRDREIPLRYWSRERLFSREARAAWADPDLRPLDAAMLDSAAPSLAD